MTVAAALAVLLQLAPAQAAPHATGQTACAACHTPAGWDKVRFDHARTGFFLRGAHASAQCSRCHGLDFAAPLARACAGCHEDVHAGDRGARCDACHDEQSWRPRFDADAHRRTNFPLTGRHALIPCSECHFEERDRAFTRAAKDCYGCHATDYARTAGTALDHARAGFSTQCRTCHGVDRWRPAVFAQHATCFQIDAGPHKSLGCFDCHTSLAAATANGTCSTNTAACTNCHTHACATTDRIHAQVPGYQCADRKCYECHRFNFAGNVRPNPNPKRPR